jgi:hypothetical protein
MPEAARVLAACLGEVDGKCPSSSAFWTRVRAGGALAMNSVPVRSITLEGLSSAA